MFHPKQNDEFFLKLRVSKQAIEKEWVSGCDGFGIPSLIAHNK